VTAHVGYSQFKGEAGHCLRQIYHWIVMKTVKNTVT